MEAEQLQQSFRERLQGGTLIDRLASEVKNIPTSSFLLGAALSVATSLTLRVMGRQHDALFVGQWAPTILLIGLYSTSIRPEVETKEGAEEREEGALH